ncbi:MAG: TIM barrel protein [Candidatus Aenigmarchaeota archaeon]|nr:TIM barrel protein [Candidatus Aenigmarchaeota archaeon]
MDSLLFGTAGIPLSTQPRDTLHGIEQVSKLGLHAMELEFVHSVNISKQTAPVVKEQSEKFNVVLTCHGQYYINLNAIENKKIKESCERILNAARIADACGAWSLCFHAGFYLKMEKEVVYDNIRKQLKEITSTLKQENNKIWLRPELTGKQTQFGDLKELIKLSSELEQVAPCIDFSHYYARTNGKQDYEKILEAVEKYLGKTALHNMHMHFSGIAFSEKGEKNHLTLQESGFDYKKLIKILKDFNVRGVLISESPNIEKDALVMHESFNKYDG